MDCRRSRGRDDWPESGDVVLSEEHDAFAWMTQEEFARACRFPALVEAVRLALEG